MLVAGDTSVESDEGFTVTLSNAGINTVINTATAAGLIVNDDVAPDYLSLSASSASKNEGNSGTTSFTFTVSRSGNTAGSTSVDYAVTGSGSNPASASDFSGSVLPSGSVSFAAGETSKTITVLVAGDTSVESDEGFTVTLSNAGVNTVINTATAAGLIVNDDVAPDYLSLSASSASKNEGNSGTTSFTFTVSRSGNTAGSTSVDYAVTGSGSNPASASDFSGSVLPSGSVSFAAGETSKTITVLVAGDTSVESDEGFTVTLSNAGVNTVINTATAAGLIVNDDVASDYLSLSASSASKNEGNSGTTSFTFTVSRSGNTAGSTSVDYAVTGSGSNPASASDFSGSVLPSGSVSFAAGETSKTITVLVAGDTSAESDEGFTVTLSNAGVNTVINTATAVGLIVNDDVASDYLSLSASSASKNEGNSGTTSFTFTVSRTGNTAGSTSVNYAVTGSGSNPASANDFSGSVLPSGSVSFAAGETSKTITVLVAGDTSVESDEGFTVTLSNAGVNTVINTATAVGLIVNDDVAPDYLSLSASSASKNEGNSGTTSFTFTVSRTGNTAGSTSVNYAVTGSGSNPASANDFSGSVLPSGNVSFAAGETSKTITVLVAGDTSVESDEGFTVTLSNAGVNTVINTATAVGLIVNDDVAPDYLSLSASSASKNEGNSGTTSFTFTVTRTGNTAGSTSVNYAVTGSGSNPASANDFSGSVLPSGSVSFRGRRDIEDDYRVGCR